MDLSGPGRGAEVNLRGKELGGRGRLTGEVGEFGQWDLAGLVVLAGDSPWVCGGQWSCWLAWD